MTELTAERLRELLDYDPATGVMLWRESGAGRRRTVAGCRARYWRIRIDGTLYKRSRLVWLWVHGHWPALHIDHINGDRHDDRLCNLREATHFQNMLNKRPGRFGRGVSLTRNGKFAAMTLRDGKRRHLGDSHCGCRR